MLNKIKQAWQALACPVDQISPTQRLKLKLFFLNDPKEIAQKKHPLLAWAYHVHAQMLSFYQDVLDTPTFCEATQMRSWQKANQIALCIVEDKPITYALEAKTIQLEEIGALREDVRTLDKQLEISHSPLGVLAAERYHAWSTLYFEHFPIAGIDQALLLQINMLAEQASIMAHPYFLSEECQAFKLHIANICLKQSAWGTPLWSSEELSMYVKTQVACHEFRTTLTRQTIKTKIALDQREARDYLALAHTHPEAPFLPERADAIQKINELHDLVNLKAWAPSANI